MKYLMFINTINFVYFFPKFICCLFFIFYFNDWRTWPVSNQQVLSTGSLPLVYSSFKSLPTLKGKNKNENPSLHHPCLLPLTTKKGTTWEMKREAKKKSVRKTKRGVSWRRVVIMVESNQEHREDEVRKESVL